MPNLPNYFKNWSIDHPHSHLKNGFRQACERTFNKRLSIVTKIAVQDSHIIRDDPLKRLDSRAGSSFEL